MRSPLSRVEEKLRDLGYTKDSRSRWVKGECVVHVCGPQKSGDCAGDVATKPLFLRAVVSRSKLVTHALSLFG